MWLVFTHESRRFQGGLPGLVCKGPWFSWLASQDCNEVSHHTSGSSVTGSCINAKDQFTLGKNLQRRDYSCLPFMLPGLWWRRSRVLGSFYEKMVLDVRHGGTRSKHLELPAWKANSSSLLIKGAELSILEQGITGKWPGEQGDILTPVLTHTHPLLISTPLSLLRPLPPLPSSTPHSIITQSHHRETKETRYHGSGCWRHHGDAAASSVDRWKVMLG